MIDIVENAAIADRDQRITALEAAVEKAEGEREQALADLHGCQDGSLVRDLRCQLTARDVAGAALVKAAQRVLDDQPREVNGAGGVPPGEFLAWRNDPCEPARRIYQPLVTANANAVTELVDALATAPAAWRK